jgi:membrane-bound serine protease (ClpP class)
LLRKVCCLFLVLLSGLVFLSAAMAAPLKVFVIPLRGEIEPGWLMFLERALEEAAAEGAAAVILEMDTPGGYIDTAQEARRLLDNFTAPVLYGSGLHHRGCGTKAAGQCTSCG